MSDLFVDRLMFGFFFLVVGVDVFGLWIVVVCKIRGGLFYNKRWVVFFICLILRVIYIEVIEEMSFLLFINVL